jgi:hypothetical protein
MKVSTTSIYSRQASAQGKNSFMHLHKITIVEAKQRITIHDLWQHFRFESEPEGSCKSPFREERKASFSVNAQGTLWHDFATGEGGDQVDFFQRASGLSQKEACLKFIEMAGGGIGSNLPVARTQRIDPPRAKPSFPTFSEGSLADLKQLSRLRNIGLEGLQFASERGLLWFTVLYGFDAWIVTDIERVNAQARRLDGGLWDHLEGKPKAFTLSGSWATWPLGIREAQQFKTIALCEGGPDLLSAHYLTLWEGSSHYMKRDVSCAPVTMLGASLQIHPKALPLFAGRHVRIIGHDDNAGQAAVKSWALQLESVGAEVDAFSFAGLRQGDGKPVKDLNDSLLMDAASFAEAERMLP